MVDPPESRPRLLIARAEGEVAFDCYGNETWIGSHRSCDLVLRGEGVEGRHARIEWQSGRVYLFALEGEVLVSGTPRREWLLRDGDTLQLGEVLLRFTFPPPAVAPEVVEPTPVRTPVTVPVTPNTPRRPSSRRARREEEGDVRPSRRTWLVFVPFLIALGIAIWMLVERLSRPVERRVKHGTYMMQAILPLESALAREPRAARLLRLRCKTFLEQNPTSPSCDRVREALAAAERAGATSEDWTYDQLRFAVIELAPPAKVDTRDVVRERITILRAFLDHGVDPRGKEEAQAWLAEAEAALAGAQKD
ncbi:MAG: FHA domain-containing protein [Planctomycetes bacterium]|nr:FHA domain-containing protein [Planctomycetota bacterium]